MPACGTNVRHGFMLRIKRTSSLSSHCLMVCFKLACHILYDRPDVNTATTALVTTSSTQILEQLAELHASGWLKM